MPGIEQTMASYYAARAPEYDRVYQKPERQADIRQVQEWLPPIFEGASVIDVACGTAYWAQFIARRADQILGVDASIQTLFVAKHRLLSNVKLIVGDAYRLPARSPRFHAAFVGFWISHIPRARRCEFLAELHRVLQPEGAVVFLDNLYVEGSSQKVVERDEGGNTYQRRKLDDGSTHLVLKNFPTEPELRELARAVGASRIEYRAWEYYWALQYVAPPPH